MTSISMLVMERQFSSKLQLAVLDDDHIVLASFAGLPESVRAIAAGFLENRPMTITGKEYYRIQSDPYRLITKPIGLGDVAHGMVYNDLATIEGLTKVANIEEADTLKSYIFANGDIKRAIGEHMAERFSLPSAWVDQYYQLFSKYIQLLQIEQPILLYPDYQAARLNISEQEVKSVMNTALQTGFLTIEKNNMQGVFHEDMTKKEYLTENANTLATKLIKKKPRYVYGDPIHPSIGNMKRVPFPAQAAVVQGLWDAFQDGENLCLINGTMGTGKSIMACAMMNRFYHDALDKGKDGVAILLSAPSITLTKWKNKEILGTLPHAKVEIIKDVTDALKLKKKVREGYRPHGLEVYITSLDRAKLGHVPYFAGIWKRLPHSKAHYTWHCPICHQPLVKKDEDGENYVYLEWEDIAEGHAPDPIDIQTEHLLPNGLPYIPKWKKTGKKYDTCNYHLEDPDHTCRAKLWRAAVQSRGETKFKPRWNTSKVLKSIKGFFNLYIADEIHQAKADDSGRGDAFAQLAKTAPKILGLTGTLTTGKSSSVKSILWRTMPERLLKQGFNHRTGAVQWAKRYGKVKQVYRIEDEDKGWIVRKKRTPEIPQEEPGINPQLTVQLLDFTAFLDLPEIQLPLVPLKEEVEIIEMDEDHKAQYSQFHSTLHNTCSNRSRKGSRGAWSKFIPSTINYGDRPDLGANVVFSTKDELGNIITEEVKADPFPETYFHAKERRLAEIVENELANDRGCVIYNNYTGGFKMNERTKFVLEEHGIPSDIIVILNESNTLKRDELLQRYAKEGKKVIITNVKLVEVGLDLMDWPTIIFNQLNYEINTVRQAGRRAWRIGQERECKVYYLVYDGSQQMAQFQHLVAQRSHALMVEGVLDKSPLANFAKDEQSVLAADLASCFAQNGIAEIWRTLADKELESLEIVDESQFKDTLKQRMRDLSNRTLSLCRLPSLEEREEQAEQPVVKETEEPKIEYIVGEQQEENDESDFDFIFAEAQYEDEESDFEQLVLF